MQAPTFHFQIMNRTLLSSTSDINQLLYLQWLLDSHLALVVHVELLAYCDKQFDDVHVLVLSLEQVLAVDQE